MYVRFSIQSQGVYVRLNLCGCLLPADPVVWALQQKGVSQDEMPQYIRQNMYVTDSDTGDRYQLVPDSNQEESVSPNASSIMIGEESVQETKVTC